MSRTDSHQGLNLGGCLDQVRGFVRDRCSGVCALLKPDKPVPSTLVQSRPSSQNSTAPGVPVSDFSRLKIANNHLLSTSLGTPVDEYVSREELGRATWLLLHTLAAQYPDKPSKQQRKDVTAMVRAV